MKINFQKGRRQTRKVEGVQARRQPDVIPHWQVARQTRSEQEGGVVMTIRQAEYRDESNQTGEWADKSGRMAEK